MTRVTGVPDDHLQGAAPQDDHLRVAVPPNDHLQEATKTTTVVTWGVTRVEGGTGQKEEKKEKEKEEKEENKEENKFLHMGGQLDQSKVEQGVLADLKTRKWKKC